MQTVPETTELGSQKSLSIQITPIKSRPKSAALKKDYLQEQQLKQIQESRSVQRINFKAALDQRQEIQIK